MVYLLIEYFKNRNKWTWARIMSNVGVDSLTWKKCHIWHWNLTVILNYCCFVLFWIISLLAFSSRTMTWMAVNWILPTMRKSGIVTAQGIKLNRLELLFGINFVCFFFPLKHKTSSIMLNVWAVLLLKCSIRHLEQ